MSFQKWPVLDFEVAASSWNPVVMLEPQFIAKIDNIRILQ